MEPLLDIVKHFKLREKVVDDLARSYRQNVAGDQKLINTVDEMQLQLKKNMNFLAEISRLIDDESEKIRQVTKNAI